MENYNKNFIKVFFFYKKYNIMDVLNAKDWQGGIERCQIVVIIIQKEQKQKELIKKQIKTQQQRKKM